MKKVFSLFLIFFSLTLFLYTFYKSEYIHLGSNRNYYILYYIFSFILFLLSLLIFFFQEEIFLFIKIFFFSVFFLYIFETFFIFFNFDNYQLKNKEKIYLKKTKKKYDNRTLFQIYSDLKSTGENVTVPAYPYIYHRENISSEIFPFSGISNIKTISCNENGYFATYQSDRFGFNNPDYEWDKESIDYIIVGDSFGHGACVNRPDDIASILRKNFNKSVLNLSYGGNGPLIELATLKEYKPKNFRNIIWLYVEKNDTLNLAEEITNNILKKYLIEDNFTQNLKSKQILINKLSRDLIDNYELKHIDENEKKINNVDIYTKIINFIKLSKTRGFIYSYLPKNVQYKSKPKPPPSEELKQIFIKVKNIAKEHNSNFYVAYLPEYGRFILKNYDQTNYYLFKDLINKSKLNFIDLKETISNLEDPLSVFPFRLNGHFNEKGYKIIAEEIYMKNSN